MTVVFENKDWLVEMHDQCWMTFLICYDSVQKIKKKNSHNTLAINLLVPGINPWCLPVNMVYEVYFTVRCIGLFPACRKWHRWTAISRSRHIENKVPFMSFRSFCKTFTAWKQKLILALSDHYSLLVFLVEFSIHLWWPFASLCYRIAVNK